MFKFVVLTALLAIASAGTVPGGKIVGGDATTIEERPYQVSIQKRGGHFCGGTLIKEDIVLTAAHCLQGEININDLSVRVGSTDRRKGGQAVKVKAFVNHPLYSKRTSSNDVAIIRLVKNVTLNKSVQTIGLASVTPPTGTEAVVSGWGVTEFKARFAPTSLLEAIVKIVDYKDCGSSPYKYGALRIKKTMVCAVEEGKDACQGDSGGPLVANDELVGVVSFGNGCAEPGYPGVYADVAYFRDWIVETAGSI